MFRKFTLATAALALVFTTAFSAPAHADNDNLKQLLAGAAALAIIGSVLNDEARAAPRGHVVTRQAPPQYHRAPAPRHLPRHVARRDLPGQCFRAYPTRRGDVRMFGQRCLNRNYAFAASLPNACAQSIRTYSGVRSGYDPRCLRGYGYRIARN